MVETGTGRRANGFLESEIMVVLWAAAQPMTPGDVHAALAGELAYTTVQTVLTRLLDKRQVHRQARGRAHVYWPVSDAATAAARAMSAALTARADREAVLQHFAAGLDPADAAALRAFLAEDTTVGPAS